MRDIRASTTLPLDTGAQQQQQRLAREIFERARRARERLLQPAARARALRRVAAAAALGWSAEEAAAAAEGERERERERLLI